MEVHWVGCGSSESGMPVCNVLWYCSRCHHYIALNNNWWDQTTHREQWPSTPLCGSLIIYIHYCWPMHCVICNFRHTLQAPWWDRLGIQPEMIYCSWFIKYTYVVWLSMEICMDRHQQLRMLQEEIEAHSRLWLWFKNVSREIGRGGSSCEVWKPRFFFIHCQESLEEYHGRVPRTT